MRGKRFRSGLRSVDDHDAFKAARNQCIDDRPRGSAGADDNGNPLPLRPAEARLVHIGKKTGDIRIVAPQTPVFSP